MANFYGGSGNDTWTGDGTNEEAFGYGGRDALNGGAGNDSLYGGSADDTLTGESGNDILDGGTGVDVMAGGDGDDSFILSSTFGNDTITGGEGAETRGDTLTASGASLAVTVTFTGSEAGTIGDGLSTASFSEIEAFVLSGLNDSMNAALAASSVTVDGGAGADTLTGGSGADRFTGGTGADSLTGNAGNDTFEGGSGNDTQIGGAGDDTFLLIDGFGVDVITAGETADSQNDVIDASAMTSGVTVTLTASEAGTVVQGANSASFTQVERFVLTGQADSFNASATTSPVHVNAGAGNDTLTGSGGADTIVGGTGADSIQAGAGNDFVQDENASGTVAGGNDTIDLGAGDDTYIGTGTGDNDLIQGGAGNDFVSALGGNDTLFGGSGNDFLIAGSDTLVSQGDALFGGMGADTLLGAGTADSLDGGEGRDRLFGGAGNDTLSGGNIVSGIGATYLTNGTFSSGTAGWTGTDMEINAESSYFGGGSGSNSVAEIDGNSGQTTVMSQSFDVAGQQTASLTFRAAVRTAGTGIVGTDGFRVEVLDSSGNVIFSQTVLPGSSFANYSYAFTFPAAGTYTFRLTELGNNDSLGAVIDDVQITATSDVVDTADDALSGGDGDDSLSGFAGNDTLSGDGGNDNLDGGTGNDLMDGGAGLDVLVGGTGQDTLTGGTENDQLYGGADDDQLFGGDGSDVLVAGDGADLIDGGAGADIAAGGIGNDTFLAGIGDTIDGGENAGDQDLLDLRAWGWSLTNVIYDPMNPENGTVQFLDAFGGVVGTMNFSNIERIITCFTPGTRIATDCGEVLVENLKAGDRVLTRDNGYKPLLWVGQRHLNLAELVVQPQLRPITIAAGALGHGLPRRTMTVSPQHRMLFSGPRAALLFGENEVLVAAIHLVGQPGITQTLTPGVTYLHFLFDEHELVLADGAWSESFQPAQRNLKDMDQAQRDEILALFPELAANAGAFPAARMTLKAHEARVLLAA